MYEDWELDIIAEAKAEADQSDVVRRKITYRTFVSRSKGIRNGRRRYRRNWKEVRLVKYNNGFHLWHRFTFDVYATEIMGKMVGKDDAEESLKQAIIRRWGQ